MAETRVPREVANRQQSMRPQQWKPAEVLPEPDKQPGFAYRWVRTATLNQADPRNLSAKLREGWEPVNASEQPQLQLLVDPGSRFKDNIEISGLLLCKTPVEFIEQRNAYIQKQTDAQTQAVDNNLMRQSDPRMPIFRESRSEVSKGSRSS